MNKRLQILKAIYEGEAADAGSLQARDESLNKEAKAIKEMKGVLDNRDAGVPDPVTLDAITSIARETWQRSHHPGQLRAVKKTRHPVRHARIYAMRMAAAAAVVFAVVMVGLWQFGPSNSMENPQSGEQSLAADEALAPGSLKDAGSGFLADDSNLRVAAEADAIGDSIPSWSDPDDLMMVRRRVQTLRRTSNSLEWDDAVLPLEMMPSGGAADGFQQASASRPNTP